MRFSPLAPMQADDATGKIVLSVASGLMMRPLFRLFFLMYAQIAFVTSAEISPAQNTATAEDAEICSDRIK